MENVFFELFPLNRELFEIYFVRLIGTPNQIYYSKYGYGLMGYILVVQNH